MESSEILRLPFREALYAWLEGYRVHIASKTYKDYRWDAKALGSYPEFAKRRLSEVTADAMHGYQRKRLDEDKLERLSVNHELDFLARVRKQLEMPVTGYKRLRVPFVIKGRALSEDERARILKLARDNPYWMGAYLYLALSLNIGCGPKECFTIRLRDVHLDDPIPHVEVGNRGRGPDGGKNEFRPRRCALNRESLGAVEQALERARSLGARDPEDYLFPFRVSALEGYDAKRHMTTIKTAWKSLRKAAGIPHLRQYDMRHHCTTVMLENPEISDQTVEDTIGHIDPRTKRYYSHIRLKARQRAAALIIGDRAPEDETKQTNGGGRKPPGRSADRVARAIRKTDLETAATRELIAVLGGLSDILKKRA